MSLVSALCKKVILIDKELSSIEELCAALNMESVIFLFSGGKISLDEIQKRLNILYDTQINKISMDWDTLMTVKIQQVDEVTGNPRFGEQTLTKIHTHHTLYQECIVRYNISCSCLYSVSFRCLASCSL